MKTVEFTFQATDQHVEALQAMDLEQRTLAATAAGIMAKRPQPEPVRDRGRKHRQRLLDAKIRRLGVRSAAALCRS